MPVIKPDTILEHSFAPVKSPVNGRSSPGPEPMTHHKVFPVPRYKQVLTYSTVGNSRYGVSQSRRILPPGILLKRLDIIRRCLAGTLGLSPVQVEVTVRLLRLYAYYGRVYPKASQVAGEPDVTPQMTAWRAEQGLGAPRKSYGCSRATFWRTIKILEELGLVEITSRYVMRPHAQISNLYRLDQLVLVLARYIAEHGRLDRADWLIPALTMPPRLFWSFLSRAPGDRAGPGDGVFQDLLSSRVAAS